MNSETANAPARFRRALITASANGIGAVLARRASAVGYEVIISDRDVAAGKRLAKKLGAAFIPCDLENEEAIVALVREAGTVDLLINNGGISGPVGPLKSLSSHDWRQVLDVNLTAQYIACREMIPCMEAAGRGGCIINMSSVAAQIGYPDRAAYAASKAGVLGLTAALAREVGGQGIRVNAILPATTRGDRIDRVIAEFGRSKGVSREEAEAAYLSRHAIPTMIEPDDIAETILFLAGPYGRSITGQFIRVDGGFQ